VTPDSFSDGGDFLDREAAVARAYRLVDSGAHILDVGGESSRPGAEKVSTQEEIERVMPVIEPLAREMKNVILSVDTTRAEVAASALDAGADMVNDVSGLTADPLMASVVARFHAGLVVMHRKGSSKNMQDDPRYDDLFLEVREFLGAAVRRAEEAGVASDSIFVDPGIGFGKTLDHNLRLIQGLEFLTALEKPIFVGPSRKRFIGEVLGAPVGGRLHGTAAAVTAAILHGAHAVRVHDLPALVEVARMADAIVNETHP